MFGPEVAMDELAEALGLDPVELRIRNEPEVDPNSGKPWSSRLLVRCLREGAERFGWADRGPAGAGTATGWSAWGWPARSTRCTARAGRR